MTEYIDREELLTQMGKWGTIDKVDAMAIARIAPAADVAPVVHASWAAASEEAHPICWYCTHCDESFEIFGYPPQEGYKYCPVCGAKMDEEV